MALNGFTINTLQRNGLGQKGLLLVPRREGKTLREFTISPREAQIAVCYADGFTSTEIAAALGLTSETVRDYLRAIRLKYKARGLDASTKSQLRFRLAEDGLLAD